MSNEYTLLIPTEVIRHRLHETRLVKMSPSALPAGNQLPQRHHVEIYQPIPNISKSAPSQPPKEFHKTRPSTPIPSPVNYPTTSSHHEFPSCQQFSSFQSDLQKTITIDKEGYVLIPAGILERVGISDGILDPDPIFGLWRTSLLGAMDVFAQEHRFKPTVELCLTLIHLKSLSLSCWSAKPTLVKYREEKLVELWGERITVRFKGREIKAYIEGARRCSNSRYTLLIYSSDGTMLSVEATLEAIWEELICGCDL